MFPLVDTHGLPLELVIDRLREQGVMPDWIDFWDEAMASGWKPASTLTRLTEAVGDVYGPSFRLGWEAKFKSLR